MLLHTAELYNLYAIPTEKHHLMPILYKNRYINSICTNVVQTINA